MEENREKLTCNKGCKKSFVNESKLKRHLMIHTQNKPLKCDFCGKIFNNTFLKNIHIRVHKKIKITNKKVKIFETLDYLNQYKFNQDDNNLNQGRNFDWNDDEFFENTPKDTESWGSSSEIELGKYIIKLYDERKNLKEY